tara:strand:- start:921 stop:1124 length:204 start_codon:yes stop_codon:yes gene_type:complete
METKKEKIQLNDFELEFIIDVLEKDKIETQWFLDNKELDMLFKLYNEVITKLNTMLIVSKNKTVNKI